MFDGSCEPNFSKMSNPELQDLRCTSILIQTVMSTSVGGSTLPIPVTDEDLAFTSTEPMRHRRLAHLILELKSLGLVDDLLLMQP